MWRHWRLWRAWRTDCLWVIEDPYAVQDHVFCLCQSSRTRGGPGVNAGISARCGDIVVLASEFVYAARRVSIINGVAV